MRQRRSNSSKRNSSVAMVSPGEESNSSWEVVESAEEIRSLRRKNSDGRSSLKSEIDLQLLRQVGAWLEQESGIELDYSTEESFVRDLRDGVAICTILKKAGLLAFHHGQDGEHVGKVKRKENLRMIHQSMESHGHSSYLDATFPEEITMDNLDTKILPFLLGLKSLLAERRVRRKSSVDSRPKDKQQRKSKKKKKLKKLIQDEIERRESISRQEEQDEEVTEALNSIFGLVIFLFSMLCIFTFVGDIVGITNFGFAHLLGIREAGTVPVKETNWYTDMKKPWASF